MKELKAGIVGSGGIADYHISGYLKSGVDVVAICDIDTKRAEDKAKKYNIKNVYSSYREMIEKERGLDIVSVYL